MSGFVRQSGGLAAILIIFCGLVLPAFCSGLPANPTSPSAAVNGGCHQHPKPIHEPQQDKKCCITGAPLKAAAFPNPAIAEPGTVKDICEALVNSQASFRVESMFDRPRLPFFSVLRI